MPNAAEKWRPKFSQQLEQSTEDKKLRGRRKLAVVAPPSKEEKKKKQIYAAVDLTGTQSIHGEQLICTERIIGIDGHPRTITQTRMQTLMHNDTLWRTWAADNCVTAVQTEWVIHPAHAITYDTWTTGAAASSVTIWREWVDGQEVAPHRRPPLYNPRIQVQESEEQKKLRAEQEARWKAEDEARQKKWKEEEEQRLKAKETAMQLLISCLTEEQRRDLKNNKFFYVEAPSGRLYRIDQGTHGNVKVVDRRTKVWIEQLCIQPNGVPEGDSMLVQKMMIETAEDVFRSHANITLKDGKLLYGRVGLLDASRMAEVIPITRKAA